MFPRKHSLRRLPPGDADHSETRRSPLLAVQHHGHLNLDNPEYYSDFFFWQNSEIAGKDLLAIFWMPQIPVDRATWDELSHNNIKGVAVDPRCPRITDMPVFISEVGILHDVWKRIAPLLSRASNEQKFLLHEFTCYSDRRNYWMNLFDRLNVRIHVTWYWVGGEHTAIAGAMERLGGVSAIYERSLHFIASSEMAIASDVFFGFSQDSVERQARNGSDIRYSVVTGYVGDHRFPLLHNSAAHVRSQLRKNGAQHIMAFFDEDSADDRWDIGYGLQRENYDFLLEKILDCEWFGLVLKPKIPGTLRARLGPAAELLSAAIQTGRCFVFEGGPLESKFPPAVAALASDVAVHGHLYSPTAAFEAALAGVPTLLMDREGCPLSPLYDLGVGRVVFNEWNDLWKTYLNHSQGRLKVPGFGDWSTMLDHLDPYRDGRAAERMGQYLHWILEGLQHGMDREGALAVAAERYCNIWGNDKVRTLKPTVALPTL